MASYKEISTNYAVNISSNDIEQEASAMENTRYADIDCDPCNRDGKQNKYAGFCVDCDEHLCLGCFNVHKKFKLLQHHVLLDETNMLQTKTSEKVKDICVEKCPLHMDRVIEYICQSCDKLCCSVCIIKDHRKCDPVDFIPDISENIEQSKLYLDVSKAIEDQYDLLNIHEGNCEINQCKSRKLRDSAKEDVRITYQEVHTWLLQKEKEMMEKIETKYNEEQQRFDNVSAEVSTLKDDLENIKLNFTTHMKSSKKCQLFVTLQRAKLTIHGIQSRVQELEKVAKFQSYHFKEAAFIEDIKTQIELGNIQETSSYTEKKIKFLYSIDTRKRYSGKMCIISEKILILRESFLTTLSLDPEKKEEPALFEVDLNSLPADITKISKADVAVTFPRDGIIKLYVVKPTGHIAEKKTIQVGKGCEGIQYFKNNFIVSFCHHESGSVSIIDISGQHIKEIVGSSKLLFQSPVSLALNPRNEILYIADRSNGRVTSLTLDGTIINNFESEECDLYAISTDEHGSVYAFYVCLPKIIQLSDKCSLVKAYELKDNCVETAYLHAVFSEINNLMYASTHSGQIRVFDII